MVGWLLLVTAYPTLSLGGDMGHEVGGVACRRSLCQHLVLVVALFVTLALGVEVSNGKRAKRD